MKQLLKQLIFATACLCSIAQTQAGETLSFQEALRRAQPGDSFGQAVVAMHYQLGWQTEKNLPMAAKYAIESAKAGEPLGQYRLGVLLRAGEGVPLDEQRGLAYQAAAFKGLNLSPDPYSITASGILIFQGKAVWQNVPQQERFEMAARLYKAAADMGYAPAQFNYAMCARDGHGVKKDLSVYKNYIDLAASNQYPLADHFYEFVAQNSSNMTTNNMNFSLQNEIVPHWQNFSDDAISCMDINLRDNLLLLGSNVHEGVSLYDLRSGRLIRQINVGFPVEGVIFSDKSKKFFCLWNTH